MSQTMESTERPSLIRWFRGLVGGAAARPPASGGSAAGGLPETGEEGLPTAGGAFFPPFLERMVEEAGEESPAELEALERAMTTGVQADPPRVEEPMDESEIFRDLAEHMGEAANRFSLLAERSRVRHEGSEIQSD